MKYNLAEQVEKKKKSKRATSSFFFFIIYISLFQQYLYQKISIYTQTVALFDVAFILQ